MVRAKYLTFEESEKPSDLPSFLAKHELTHGDVVHFDDGQSERDDNSWIVAKHPSEEKRLIWIRNPNELQCDFLTIPLRITEHIAEAVVHYQDIIEKVGTMNIHLGPHDKIIVRRFGKVPSDWLFDYFFEDGELSQVHLRLPGKDSEIDLDVKNLSPASVKQYLPPAA